MRVPYYSPKPASAHFRVLVRIKSDESPLSVRYKSDHPRGFHRVLIGILPDTGRGSSLFSGHPFVHTSVPSEETPKQQQPAALFVLFLCEQSEVDVRSQMSDMEGSLIF